MKILGIRAAHLHCCIVQGTDLGTHPKTISLFELLPQVMHALREVDFDSAVVDEDIVHLEVSLFTRGITVGEANREWG